MEKNDDLFGNLDSTMSFLSEKKEQAKDGIYRVDLTKAEKGKPYRSVIRFLPNLKKDGTLGEAAIEKVAHYVDIKQLPELCGYYDSPKNPAIQKINPGAKCPLTELYYSMQNSKNAQLIEKSKMLKYSKKYFSYVLVVDDPQQPHLNGKILIFQYGKTLKDKITAEKNGEISGESVNVFNLEAGKDFVLLVKQIDTGDEKYPDYKMSSFKPERSSIMIPTNNGLKNVPLEDGKIAEKLRGKVREFLLDRDTELESYEPKVLTEEQQAKITQIGAYLTGKTVATFAQSNKPESSDFDFGVDSAEPASTKKPVQNVDDFDFDDL